jgi:hypothetical protein
MRHLVLVNDTVHNLAANPPAEMAKGIILLGPDRTYYRYELERIGQFASQLPNGVFIAMTKTEDHSGGQERLAHCTNWSARVSGTQRGQDFSLLPLAQIVEHLKRDFPE